MQCLLLSHLVGSTSLFPNMATRGRSASTQGRMLCLGLFYLATRQGWTIENSQLLENDRGLGSSPRQDTPSLMPHVYATDGSHQLERICIGVSTRLRANLAATFFTSGQKRAGVAQHPPRAAFVVPISASVDGAIRANSS